MISRSLSTAPVNTPMISLSFSALIFFNSAGKDNFFNISPAFGIVGAHAAPDINRRQTPVDLAVGFHQLLTVTGHRFVLGPGVNATVFQPLGQHVQQERRPDAGQFVGQGTGGVGGRYGDGGAARMGPVSMPASSSITDTPVN